MSTRKHTRARRRKAHKPTTYLVDGHELTPEQYEDYERRTLAGGKSDVALRDVLWNARPSVQAQKVFDGGSLYERAKLAMQGLAALSSGQLYARDPEYVHLYNQIVGHLAAEFRALEEELSAHHIAIAAETFKAKEARS